MGDMCQLFNNEAQSNYYTSRPEYSSIIVEEIINFWKSFNGNRQTNKGLDIVDVGCGTGQLTSLLIPYSKHILGIDSSESQINVARQMFPETESTKFTVGSCYHIPVADSSIDLITAAQCIHWFDLNKFYAEVDRSLKKNGVFVISNYSKGHFVVDGVDDRNSALNKFVTEDLWFDKKYFGSSFNKEQKFTASLLPGIPILYSSTGKRNDNLVVEMKMTLSRYRKYILSTAIYRKWKEEHPNDRDMIDVLVETILALLDNPEISLDTELTFKIPLTLILCSKP